MLPKLRWRIIPLKRYKLNLFIQEKNLILEKCLLCQISGGEGRIRTYVAEAADLQSAGINHSPTSPYQGDYFCSRMHLSQLIFLN